MVSSAEIDRFTEYMETLEHENEILRAIVGFRLSVIKRGENVQAGRRNS